jgi:hypothetical protein
MSQTGTYNCSDQEGIKQWIKKCLRNILSPEKPTEYIPSQDESGNEK